MSCPLHAKITSISRLHGPRQLAIILCLLFFGGFPFPQPSLALELLGPAPANFPTGSGPLSLAAGDFNLDGILDLATANSESDSVGILLGDGLGSFSQIAEVPVGDGPLSIAGADLNADGAPDLAVVNGLGNTVSILLGDGLGGFSRADHAVGEIPAFVAIGDLNTDGAPDLALASLGSKAVRIFLGDGLGGFTLATDLPVAGSPSAVLVRDLDADGDFDLAVSDGATSAIDIFSGDGLGHFAQTAEISLINQVPVSPGFLVAGDFNSDRAADLAVAIGTNLPGTAAVSILLGDGRGGFSRAPDLSVPLPPRSIALSDYNGDGADDLAVAVTGRVSDPSDTVTIFLGDGLGGFSRTVDLRAGFNPFFVAAGDFNTDGAQDLAVAIFGIHNFTSLRASSSLTLLLGDGLGGFSQSSELPAQLAPSSVATGDFNDDGAADLAVAKRVSQTVSFYLGNGLGNFAQTSEIPLGDAAFSVTVADFNTDSIEDLAVVHGFRTLSIFLGDEFGSFSRAADFEMGLGVLSIAVGDFDLDADADLALGLFDPDSPSDPVVILLGDGLGNFSRSGDVRSGKEPVSIAVATLDADAVADLAVANLGSDTISILRGDGLGGFSKTADLFAGFAPTSVATGDFNMDGAEDLAVANEFHDTVSILLGNGQGTFIPQDAVQVGDAPVIVTVGDFNADGVPDLAVAARDASTLNILIGSDLGDFFRINDFLVGEQPVSVSIGDFNADGAEDLVVANERDNSLSVFLNQAAGRVDVNGSNRVDGIEVNELGRLCGCGYSDPCYRRNVDVNLDGLIDGDDLALVAPRFGTLNKTASPLRAHLDASSPPSNPNTITFQEVASEGDLLTVQVIVNDSDAATAAADFAVTFDPAILEFVGFTPGTYFSGGSEQFYGKDDQTPGRVGLTVIRFPSQDQVVPEPAPLVSLVLHARSEGQTALEFGPLQLSQPALLDSSDREVEGVAFVGGATVTVDASAGGPPGQRIGLSPERLDFGRVDVGRSSRRSLRISNFGFSDLKISSVSASAPEFESFFTDPYTIPPFGFVELPVIFSSTGAGSFAGELVISSNDPLNPVVRVPLVGKAEPSP